MRGFTRKLAKRNMLKLQIKAMEHTWNGDNKWRREAVIIINSPREFRDLLRLIFLDMCRIHGGNSKQI